MEGILDCQIGYSKSKYYFILHESVLTFCKQQRMIGQVHLSIAKIEKRECQINITTGIEKIILLFENNQQKDVWYDCMLKQNQKLHLEDELEKVRSLQNQFETTLKFINKTIEQNPNLNSYSEKLQAYGSIFNDKLSEIVDILYQSAQPEFLSCESTNSIHTQSLKPAPIVKKAQKLKEQNYNIWGFVKNNFKQNIYQMKLPICIHLPLTMLQQISKQMKYIAILDRASQIRDLELKIALIFGFLVSQYSQTPLRLPLPSKINETFEIVDNYKYLSQQLYSNLIAFNATSANLDYNGWVEWQISMDSLIVEVHLQKQLQIIFKKNLDSFEITSDNHCISIKNLVTQKPELCIDGVFTIKLKEEKYKMLIANNNIQGQIGSLVLSGSIKKLIATNIYNEEIILFQDQEKEFEFNKHNPFLPPSDSRFRKDLIKMQEGNYYEAQQERYQLQYEGEFNQIWFEEQKSQIVGEQETRRFEYKGGYFTHQLM